MNSMMYQSDEQAATRAAAGNDVVFTGEPPYRQIMPGMIRRRDTPPHDLYTVQLANGPLK